MSYTYTDIDLSEDAADRLIDILDIIQNMEDIEIAEWVMFLLTEDKIVGSVDNV